MSLLSTILILLAAILAVFAEVVWSAPRHFLGVQIDLLPSLMVYASLSGGLLTITSLAVVGGLAFDLLSENPLGISLLPLFAIGFTIQQFRHLILRDQAFAQGVLGLGASAAMFVLTPLMLVTFGWNPMIGLGSLWQWLVLSVAGAVMTPVCFRVLDALTGALSYHKWHETSFRPDRQIQRGRH